MSITRAFTTRRVKQSMDLRDASEGTLPQRSNTTKVGGSIRNKISAPVELIHTTNMLSYNAPDLFPKSASTSSNKSDDESDSATTAASTPPTSPDSPFIEKRSLSPQPNHLSCYFSPPQQTVASMPSQEAPKIPHRSPSHTKKASYEALTRHRSTSRLSEQSSRTVSTKASFTFSRSSSSSTSTSTTSVSHPSLHASKPAVAPSAAAAGSPPTSIPPSSTTLHKKEYSDSHPFGQELAQVSELAEEYAVSVMDEDEREMQRKGLLKFSAESYLSDIQGFASSIFSADSRPAAALWI